MSSSRQQIDSVIDDDDEFCPLCIEEFDLSDKNFKPCPCGYQICQFCYNNIKTHSEEGRCPNCRRPYDDSTIQYKIPDAEEFKADLALKHRKAAAAKKKEAEKREIEASSRKNLAGVRVVQKNLVYVIGLNPTIRDENQLLQTLRGRDYFGQYGDIEKIVVSKAKPGGNPHQGIGVYVTFSRKIDAATCIAAVDGSANGDRVLRAQYGTTKYCSSFLRNEQCNNRNCTFLHETGEDSESYSRSDLSSMNTLSSQRPSHPPQPQHPPHVRPVQPITHTMRRQPSKDDSISGRSGAPDGPALPSSASWANKDATIRTRRASLTGSQASQSPRPASVTVATPVEEPKRVEKPSPVTQEAQRTSQPVSRSPTVQPAQPPSPEPPASTPFDNLVKDIMNPNFKFIFSTADLPDEEVKAIQSYPSFIDPYGGVKRRAMREKAEQERLKREQELLQSAVVEEESREAGSLQLGGEPEESNPPRGPQQSRESHGAIQPPSQQGTADNSTVGSPVSAASHQFQGLNLAGRSLTPLQQQQLMLLKSAGNQQAGIADHLSSAALDQATQLRQGLLHNQMAQFNALQGQSRQSSRFTFANDVGSKNISNARMLSQMQAGTPNPLSAPSPQHALAGGFYASGVQGPPPGLKTAGTPPISGGGMFAQGHGFTANANIGLGSNMGKHDATPELMRELLRGRGGANIGGVQGQEAAKREFMIPFLQQHPTPPPLTPVNGLLSSFYGSQTGPGLDSGGAQKQKKKGKKQRHANTSSGGGGVVDLADPSILQARMHQVGANATAGQALYGSQGQVNEDFPPLGGLLKDSQPVDTFGFLKSQLPSDSAGRVGTPSLPPGLPLPQSHPASAVFQDQLSLSKPSSPAPTLPPGLNMDISRGGTPSENNSAAEPSSLSPEFPSRTATTSARSKDVSQISLGSPVAKSAHKARMTKLDLSTLDAPTKADQSPLIGTKGSPIPLSMHLGGQESASNKSDRVSSGTLVSGPGSVAAIGSRPNTPLTTVSRVSDSSILRQPRILRVVDTPKTEIPPPITNAPSAPVSTAKSGKTQSRRQSVSSSSRPDTPGDFGSEADLFPSASVSRASSPPATTRIGSAPVRSITKSQLKKERRQKAKEAEAKQAEVVTPEEPVQAPILGRKRKTKKAPSATTSSADFAPTTVPVPEPPVPVKTPAPSPKKMEPKPEPAKKVKEKEQPPVQETKPAPVVEQPAPPPVPAEAWRSRNTVEQLIKDAEEFGRPVKDLFVERTKSLHEVLAEMHKSGELDLNKSSLFNPANLGQRTDMKGIDSDYFLLKQPLELFESHRRALMRGQPVRIDAEQLSDRCLITPRGCVLRHLSAEEEDRYLELEKNRGGAMDPFVVGDDSSNINGGLDALFATPEKYNICWVDDNSARMGATSPTGTLNTADSVIPPNVLSAMEADSERSHDWAVAHSAELLQTTTAAVRSFAAATAKQMLGSAGVPGTNPSLDDVAAMTNEELKELAGQSQKELESNRKELDVLDKKLAALLRRNKKIQQAALALAEEA
ncbi:putative CCR4-NOT core complex subunit Not4 [Penicillium brasilianum]|uniref:Putative CCR4-NOT core complex subunit Not4 n=1 Tax=Penicillium brasilianum TaxID=104259 RepID=A0A1S9RJN0_PENBI|nr:putative CCR4-NOT core complex subunit Not4 [Penicillium brasilianum]